MTFDELFVKATGITGGPFPFQRGFAEAQEPPNVVNVPTGLGKTAMVVLGWLWRRRYAPEHIRRGTPRRLVYCLPMRVLVEQTRDNAVIWLHKLGLLAGHPELEEHEGKTIIASHTPEITDPSNVAVHVLMGGENAMDWDVYPEHDAILIGTQDMLLSRALNRGYAASRARWPIQFGLLHTDSLWVFDEIQLMGSGLATTTQLEAFRHLLGSRDGHGCSSVWMSATMQRDWLKTVDFKDRIDTLLRLDLTNDDHENDEVRRRWTAVKPVQKAAARIGDAAALATEVLKAHKPGTRTIVVVNTVKRACELHKAMNKLWGANDQERLVLLHSRFRPPDREAHVGAALTDPPVGGTIVISTQVIEAGVDVSATTLFTELAPWASLVQRFGRCNRRGTQNEQARVFWVDLPTKKAEAEKVSPPYHEQPEELTKSAQWLSTLNDVGIKSLPKVQLPFEHAHVIRKRDLIDLFDITPDLAGNDIDIDRYVRELEDSDVRVFWRAWDRPKGHEPPPNDKAWRRPVRDELCSVPIGDFKTFVASKKVGGQVWRWDFLDGQWRRVNDKSDIYPGQTYLAHASTGGYDLTTGWVGTQGNAAVDPIGVVKREELTDDAYDGEELSKTGHWQTIAEHTDQVCQEIKDILASLSLNNGEAAALRTAARWHDWGKAHRKFQEVLPEGAPREGELWAKAKGEWKRYRDVGRPHFRHELASALAVLQRPHAELGEAKLTEEDLNLVAYLIAAHHGKVRLSIRSLPNETRSHAINGQPPRFARGVWDGDELPGTDLGQDKDGQRIEAPAFTLSLEPMELGLCEQPPFAGQPSWVERVIRVRDAFGMGPFRLAYMEALLRAADWRASEGAKASCTPMKPEPQPHATEVGHG